tara:strand:- start:91 stop:216 length:126 start_codon:yes stop_codon:yes gene_type:complete
MPMKGFLSWPKTALYEVYKMAKKGKFFLSSSYKGLIPVFSK